MRPGHLTLFIVPLTVVGLLAPAGVRSIAGVPVGRSTVGTPPRGGSCPAGTHLVHSSGETGIVDPDTVLYRDADYACVPDEALPADRCGPHGRPVLVNGVAACACANGYGGRTCQLCASGHARERGGRCVLAPRPRLVIEGASTALEQGQELTLAARGHRAGSTVPHLLRWRIKAGEGCLRSIEPGRGDEKGSRSDCSRTAWGQAVVFRAPTFGDTVELTGIEVRPVGPDGGPASEIGLVYVAPGSIPVTGSGDFHLLPIVRALVDFMHHRCVGAAALGVARHGQPLGAWGLGRMNGRGSLNADPACGTNAENPFDPFADNVGSDAPLLLGSVSKPITAAVLRWTLKTAWAELEPGAAPTDDDLESLLLFGPSAFPAPLFPAPLADLYGGLTPPPVLFSDSLGYDSSDSFPLCPDLTTAADPKWTQATLGHTLAHRAGLQREAPSFGTVAANLAAIRPIPDEAAFQAEEQLLVDQYGAAVIAAAKAALGGTVYFVPRPTVGEILTAVAGRCTRFPLGTYNYSNTDPSYWTTMIEQHTPSGRYAANIGDPDSHQDSALQRFFETQLGFPTTGASGIFRQQGAIGLPASAYGGPEKRGWSQSQGTYYPLDWDDKRPHCTWADDACDFQDWLDANPGRTNWSWGLDQVLFAYSGGGVGAGTGGLAAAPLAMLRFMANYWIGGYGANPRIGEPRENVWTLSTSHNGSVGGGFTFGLQYGPDATSQWSMPPISPSGHVLDDFDNLATYLCELPGNEIPDGIDIFVAVNQRGDKKCAASAALDGYTCGTAYDLLDNFVKFGICRVQNWDLVTPIWNLVGP
jgi:hypothetical protein